MFNEQLKGLPHDIQDALRNRIEDVVLLIVRRANSNNHEPDIRHYTKEEIAGMFHVIFDLAERLMPEPELPPESELPE